MAVLSRNFQKRSASALSELFTPETAFLKPVDVRAQGWTPRAEYCLLLLRSNGTSAKDVARQLGTTTGAVYSKHAGLIEALGLPKPKPAPKTSKPVRVGVGSRRDANGYVRMLIGFDEDTFNEIRCRAERHNTPFAVEVRLLVELGLDTAKLAAD